MEHILWRSNLSCYFSFLEKRNRNLTKVILNSKLFYWLIKWLNNRFGKLFNKVKEVEKKLHHLLK